MTSGYSTASTTDVADAARSAASYIVERQAENGAFFSGSSPANATGETLIALAGAGVRGLPIERALGHIADKGPADASMDPAYAGRIAMGLSAYGQDPGNFRGFDYARSIEERYDPSTGSYDAKKRIYADALAVLGLMAASRNVPSEAGNFLRRNECPGGGFGHDGGCTGGPDTDTTAIVASVLLAMGATSDDPAIQRSFVYLRLAQNTDGGFGYSPGAPTNANSTALVLSLLAKAGDPPHRWGDGKGSDPLSALLKLQNSDGGFRYRQDRPRSNDYATIQALPGILGLSYPPDRLNELPGAAVPSEAAPPSAPSGPRRAGTTPTAPGSALGPVTATGSTQASDDNNGSATVVITYPDGKTVSFCPKVSASARGIEVLRSTGSVVLTRGFGSTLGEAVCSINGKGNPAGSCLASSGHWHYWHLVGGGWIESSVGASNHIVRPGEVDGWTWSSDVSATPPPDRIPPCSARVASSSPAPKKQGWDLHRVAFLALAAAWLGLVGVRASGKLP